MTPARPIFEWAHWTFEPAEWRLTHAQSGPVLLPNKSLSLLALLLDRAPGLVSKDEILATVWSGTVVEEGNIAFHVAMLRKTIDAAGSGSCIETVRGRGYRFACPVVRRTILRDEPVLRDEVLAAEPPPAGSVAEPQEALEDITPGAVAVGTTTRRRRRWSAVLLPAAALVVAVSILGWISLTGLDARVHGVVVLPPRGASLSGADGMASAIASRLSETTLDTRAAAWLSPDEEVIEAARRLQADAVLSATIDQTQEPWRVRAELTRARDGRLLWNWMFDVPADAGALPAVVAARIAGGLTRHLGVPVSRTTPHPDALALTMRGREAWAMRTPPSVQQAIGFFERAIAIDPSYAPAYAGLANCYNLTMSGLPVDVRAAEAKANAERALTLDPSLAAAHTSQAFALYKFEWRWADAEAAFRRAIAADPSDALARHWYGDMLALIGRFDDAITQLRQARDLDPASLPILIDLAGPLLYSGRLSEARAVVEAAAGINPMYHGVPARMAEILAAEGREEESLEEDWRAQVLRGASLDAIAELRTAYRAGGRAAALRAEIARLEAGDPARFEVPVRATFLASRYAKLRDRARTLHWITIAIDRREDIALHLPTYPEYDWLRDDPEFQRQFARLGLPR